VGPILDMVVLSHDVEGTSCSCVGSQVRTQRPTGVTLPEDVARREANHVHNEWLRVRRQRRWDWSVAWAAVRAWGEDTPFKPESSRGDDENEEEGEVTPPPHSPPPEDLPSLGDLFSQQAGISIGTHRLNWSRPEAGPSTVPPPQSSLALASSDL
jgi:hypothetical protein